MGTSITAQHVGVSNVQLSSVDIRDAVRHDRLGLEPWNEDNLQPASYDVTLSPYYKVPRLDESVEPGIDIPIRIDGPAQHLWLDEHAQGGVIPLPQGSIVLVTILEHIRLPLNMACRVEGRSSVGRWFVTVHSTAGFGDPGYHGNLTLEIQNHGPFSLLLPVGMRIAQLSFHRLGTSTDKPYMGKYQGDRLPQHSLMHMERIP